MTGASVLNCFVRVVIGRIFLLNLLTFCSAFAQVFWGTSHYHCLAALNCVDRISLLIVLTIDPYNRYHHRFHTQNRTILKSDLVPSFDRLCDSHLDSLNRSESR